MKPKISTYRFESNAPLALIWEIMTNNQDATWRSDLDHIEIIDDTHFIEHSKQGAQIAFTITEKDPLKRYCFAMSHPSWNGRWSGTFSVEHGRSVVILREELQMHHPFAQLIANLFMPLQKMQKQYSIDLQRKIKEVLSES